MIRTSRVASEVHDLFDVLLTWTRDTLGGMGMAGLFFLAVIESIFFPIPVDVLLIILAAADPGLWWVYALIATAGSVLGAVIGYRIGYWGGEHVLKKYFPKKHIRRVHDLFQRYEVLAIFIAGFTPLPYKIFAVGAGVFYVSFWPFVLVSIVARGLRFLLVAYVVAWVAVNAVSGPVFNAVMAFVVLLAVEAWIAYRLWFKNA